MSVKPLPNMVELIFLHNPYEDVDSSIKNSRGAPLQSPQNVQNYYYQRLVLCRNSGRCFGRLEQKLQQSTSRMEGYSMEVIRSSRVSNHTWHHIRNIMVSTLTPLEPILEYCYLIKHVEWSIPRSEWSNRQMGVYHQRRMGTLTFDTFIIVNPTATVKKLLLQVCNKKNPEPKPTPELVHTTIANALTTRWKKRIGDLETQLADIVCEAFLFSP